jgi:hypothetical protein
VGRPNPALQQTAAANLVLESSLSLSAAAAAELSVRRREGFGVAEARRTLGDYLTEGEPVAILWPDMVDIVFHDSPRQAHPDRLGPAARTLWYVGYFQGEVINGGVSQFFSNSAGNWAHESLAALRQIGAVRCVGLLENALTLFPGGVAPVDRQKRCELLFAFEEREPQFLEELSREFYKRVDALGSVPEEDLTALQLAFMQAHRAERVRAEQGAAPDTSRM